MLTFFLSNAKKKTIEGIKTSSTKKNKCRKTLTSFKRLFNSCNEKNRNMGLTSQIESPRFTTHTIHNRELITIYIYLLNKSTSKVSNVMSN